MHVCEAAVQLWLEQWLVDCEVADGTTMQPLQFFHSFSKESRARNFTHYSSPRYINGDLAIAGEANAKLCMCMSHLMTLRFMWDLECAVLLRDIVQYQFRLTNPSAPA